MPVAHELRKAVSGGDDIVPTTTACASVAGGAAPSLVSHQRQAPMTAAAGPPPRSTAIASSSVFAPIVKGVGVGGVGMLSSPRRLATCSSSASSGLGSSSLTPSMQSLRLSCGGAPSSSCGGAPPTADADREGEEDLLALFPPLLPPPLPAMVAGGAPALTTTVCTATAAVASAVPSSAFPSSSSIVASLRVFAPPTPLGRERRIANAKGHPINANTCTATLAMRQPLPAPAEGEEEEVELLSLAAVPMASAAPSSSSSAFFSNSNTAAFLLRPAVPPPQPSPSAEGRLSTADSTPPTMACQSVLIVKEGSAADDYYSHPFSSSSYGGGCSVASGARALLSSSSSSTAAGSNTRTEIAYVFTGLGDVFGGVPEEDGSSSIGDDDGDATSSSHSDDGGGTGGSSLLKSRRGEIVHGGGLVSPSSFSGRGKGQRRRRVNPSSDDDDDHGAALVVGGAPKGQMSRVRCTAAAASHEEDDDDNAGSSEGAAHSVPVPAKRHRSPPTATRRAAAAKRKKNAGHTEKSTAGTSSKGKRKGPNAQHITDASTPLRLYTTMYRDALSSPDYYGPLAHLGLDRTKAQMASLGPTCALLGAVVDGLVAPSSSSPFSPSSVSPSLFEDVDLFVYCLVSALSRATTDEEVCGLLLLLPPSSCPAVRSALGRCKGSCTMRTRCVASTVMGGGAPAVSVVGASGGRADKKGRSGSAPFTSAASVATVVSEREQPFEIFQQFSSFLDVMRFDLINTEVILQSSSSTPSSLWVLHHHDQLPACRRMLATVRSLIVTAAYDTMAHCSPVRMAEGVVVGALQRCLLRNAEGGGAHNRGHGHSHSHHHFGTAALTPIAQLLASRAPQLRVSITFAINRLLLDLAAGGSSSPSPHLFASSPLAAAFSSLMACSSPSHLFANNILSEREVVNVLAREGKGGTEPSSSASSSCSSSLAVMALLVVLWLAVSGYTSRRVAVTLGPLLSPSSAGALAPSAALDAVEALVRGVAVVPAAVTTGGGATAVTCTTPRRGRAFAPSTSCFSATSSPAVGVGRMGASSSSSSPLHARLSSPYHSRVAVIQGLPAVVPFDSSPHLQQSNLIHPLLNAMLAVLSSIRRDCALPPYAGATCVIAGAGVMGRAGGTSGIAAMLSSPLALANATPRRRATTMGRSPLHQQQQRTGSPDVAGNTSIAAPQQSPMRWTFAYCPTPTAHASTKSVGAEECAERTSANDADEGEDVFGLPTATVSTTSMLQRLHQSLPPPPPRQGSGGLYSAVEGSSACNPHPRKRMAMGTGAGLFG